MKDFAVVGWYNAAFKLMDGLSFIPVIFITVTFPVMSRLYQKDDRRFKELIKHSAKYLIILAIPMAVGTTLIAGRIISFLYSNEFIAATIALQILIWAEAIMFINLFMGYSLNSINKQKMFTITTGICAGINILLNAIIIPKYSYQGAAVATVATQIVSFILLYLFITKEYRFSLGLFVKPVIASVVMGLALWQFKNIALWWTVPLAMVLYFAVLFLIKGLEKEDLKLIKHLLPKKFIGTPQIEE
jgi:O-antigen/teichoic acid export membrane protein